MVMDKPRLNIMDMLDDKKYFTEFYSFEILFTSLGKVTFDLYIIMYIYLYMLIVSDLQLLVSSCWLT